MCRNRQQPISIGCAFAHPTSRFPSLEIRSIMAAMMQEAVPHIETNDNPALAARTFVAFVKQDCPTFVLAMPGLREIDELIGRSRGRLGAHVPDAVSLAAGFSP